MVTRVDKFLGGLSADVTNVANVHATENRIAFGHGDTNPTANVHVIGDVLATTGFVVSNDGDIGSVGATDAIQISSGGIVTFKDDIKIKDGGTIGSASDAAAITIAASGQVTFSDVATFSGGLKVPDDGDIGSASVTDAIQISSAGIVTFKDDIKIKDGGTIGSASDADSIAIAADGVVTFTQALAHAGDFTIDAGGDVILDAAGNDVIVKNSGTEHFRFINSGSGNVVMKNPTSDKDIIFQLNDGGAATTALTLDASDRHHRFHANVRVDDAIGLAQNTSPATNSLSLGKPANVVIRTHGSGSGNVIIGDATATTPYALDVRGTANTGAFTATTITALTDGGVQVPNDGNIGSAGATDAMQISSGGIVTFKDDIIIKDAGTIGSASDPDAIAIASGGDVTVTGGNLLLAHDGSILKFGGDSEITLTHVHDAGLLLNDAGGSVSLQLHDASEAVSSDGSKLILTSNGVAFNMPTADGDADQVLTTNGSGTLSFAAAASGATDPSVTLASNIDLGNLTDATVDAFGQGITVINDLLDMPFETTLATLDLGAL
jgi:hypothetical protein